MPGTASMRASSSTHTTLPTAAITRAATQAARQLGLHVPDDLSVVGFDDHEIATRCVPALTTVRQPLREEGHMAANIALDMIKGAEPTTSVMHMQLIQRDSL